MSLYFFLFGTVCKGTVSLYFFYLARVPLFFILHSVRGNSRSVPIFFYLALSARGLCMLFVYFVLCSCIFLFDTVGQGSILVYFFYLALCARGLCPYIFFIWHSLPGDSVPIFFYLALCARGLCPYIFLFGTCPFIFYFAQCARELCPYIFLFGTVCQGTVSPYLLFGTVCQGTMFLYFFLFGTVCQGTVCLYQAQFRNNFLKNSFHFLFPLNINEYSLQIARIFLVF